MNNENYTLVVNGFNFTGSNVVSIDLRNMTIPAFRELFNLPDSDPVLGASFVINTNDELFIKLRDMTDIPMNNMLEWCAELVVGETQNQLSKRLVDEIVSEEKLFKFCKKFIADRQIRCAESVYQSDDVIENAYELITGICEIVGYYEDEKE